MFAGVSGRRVEVDLFWRLFVWREIHDPSLEVFTLLELSSLSSFQNESRPSPNSDQGLSRYSDKFWVETESRWDRVCHDHISLRRFWAWEVYRTGQDWSQESESKQVWAKTKSRFGRVCQNQLGLSGFTDTSRLSQDWVQLKCSGKQISTS